MPLLWSWLVLRVANTLRMKSLSVRLHSFSLFLSPSFRRSFDRRDFLLVVPFFVVVTILMAEDDIIDDVTVAGKEDLGSALELTQLL